MADNTPLSHRNLVIYEVYVRNHGANGTFADVQADLPRIHSMGVDIVWFMPIHPIGQLNKKGGLGCPYSIQDYTQTNPEYGTKEEFAQLVQAAHTLGMKVMIDVVYNHTSHDAVLVQQYPHWYHQNEQGKPVTTVPDWSDVIDLHYGDPALADYLISCLKGWVELGVDGFRCDVASVVPISFWQRARQEVAMLKPDVIWLAEAVHASFVESRRRAVLTAHSDSEVYTAFDLTYDYDIWPIWEAAVDGVLPLSHYVGALRLQDGIYPVNYVKMRCVENHDQPRFARRVADRNRLKAWIAFMAFNKGAFLIYGGQESENRHTPSLFDVDKVVWGEYSLQPFLTKLALLKKHPAQQTGLFTLLGAERVLTASWQTMGGGLWGVFNVSAETGEMETILPNGRYNDLLNGEEVEVRGGRVKMPASAAILSYTGQIPNTPVYTPFMEYHWHG